MKKAFTMIEIIFVIVIIGILASVALPRLAATRDDALIAKNSEYIMGIMTEISTYIVAKGKSKDDLSEMSFLLESLKGVVKQYWDIDTEVAEEILEMKKDAESKVEQYREMLKNEHSRLSEAQEENETLKKSVILEKKASILSTDKKEALTKLSENIDADKLESQIDSLMESVVDTFNAGFTSTEINKQINKKEINNDTLNESTQSIISSGDTETKASTELSNLMDLAGIR